MSPSLRAALLTATALFASPSAARAQDCSVDLLVAATTDVHGRLRAWDYFADSAESVRGLARLATAVDSIRRANPGRLLLVDSGDLLQGNPMTFVASRAPARPHPVIAAMNTMGYDAAAIGNHEFNYGVPRLERAVAQAQFPFLAANARRINGARAFPAFTLIERSGVKIAIIGVTNPGANIWDRGNLRGRITVEPIIPAVRTAVDSARAAGASVVVALLHSGFNGPSSFDTTGTGPENAAAQVARDVPGIDLIVFGHSHREVADTTVNGVLLVQPRQWGGSLAVATLRLAQNGTQWSIVSKHGQLIRARGHDESPAVVRAVAAAHDAARTYTRRNIGTTPTTWRSESARTHDTPIIDWVLDVQRRVWNADLASTSAFDLGATLGPDKITVAQLARLYPYENTLQLVRISGAALRAYLEQSARFFVVEHGATPRVTTDPDIPGYNFDIVGGAEYVIDLSRPMGERITMLRFKGRDVTPTDSFTLAVNNYRAGGGGGYAMLRGARVLRDTQVEIRDLLIADVERRKGLDASQYTDRHWRIEPPVPSQAPTPTNTPKSLRIISINDYHGALEPRLDGNQGNRGGAAQVAQAIRNAQRECAPACATVLLDAGDMFQGTAASNLAYGRPVTRFFNALNFAAGALGNHDFDWGQDTLRARMADLHHAVLGANVTFADGSNVPWIRGDTIVERNGVRIGIIGISTELTPMVTMARNVANLRFVPPAPIVNARTRALRQRGATVVLVTAHDGGFCDTRGQVPACNGEVFDWANQITEKVDALITGHTHSVINTTVNGIPIVQARSNGRAIAIVDLPLNASGSVAGESRRAIRNVDADTIGADPEVAAIVRDATASLGPRISERIAELRAPLLRRGEQFPLGNLIADAQRAAAKADIAVMNNGGIRADLQAGTITYGALFEVHPFGNVLYRVTATGAALRAYFEKLYSGQRPPRIHVSGVALTWDSARPVGQRLVNVRLANGQLLDAAREYTVALTDFLLTGGDGLGLGDAARKVEPVNIQDLDALIMYVRAMPGGFIVADEAPRLTILNQ